MPGANFDMDELLERANYNVFMQSSWQALKNPDEVLVTRHAVHFKSLVAKLVSTYF